MYVRYFVPIFFFFSLVCFFVPCVYVLLAHLSDLDIFVCVCVCRFSLVLISLAEDLSFNAIFFFYYSFLKLHPVIFFFFFFRNLFELL